MSAPFKRRAKDSFSAHFLPSNDAFEADLPLKLDQKCVFL